MKTVSASNIVAHLQHSAVVDVRTDAEFQRGHIPLAVNRPLLSNSERASVGWLYKHAGRPAALNRGWAMVMPKLEAFLQSFEAWRPQSVLVYCARGGMRSESVCKVLQQRGFFAIQLQGGYKAFRQWILQRIPQLIPNQVLVLQGLTGVGKTRLLQRLNNHLDLEACAQHRGSLFGAVGLQPHTQQQFEARLWLALEKLDLTQLMWIEAESSKIGSVLLPNTLHLTIRNNPKILITAPLKSRLERIIADYGLLTNQGKQQLEKAIQSLKSLLGKKCTQQLSQWLHQNQLENIVRLLLKNYYDPRYRRSMGPPNWATIIDNQNLPQATQQLADFGKLKTKPDVSSISRQEAHLPL